MARDASLSTSKSFPKVGKYSVFVNDFEKLAIPLLKSAETQKSLLIIDEIGKMELLSRSFTSEVEKILVELQNPTCDRKLIATVPVAGRVNIPLVESLKKVPNSKLFTVTKSNRDLMYNEIKSCVNAFVVK